MSFLDYRPPKTIRALFIIHYAPLLLIIMIGPQSVLFQTWLLPTPLILTISTGMIIFLIGTVFYFKWEYFWYKTFHGQLVTNGIFKYIRHPHYTSLLIIGYGLALFFNSIPALIIATIAIPIMMISIIDEERLLIKQYGKQYETFMKQTPWRMIPRFF
ncbi:protein-S-isoprenylcysteine methyltransferase [Thermoplasmatales archaeon ex4572_165]|nr:MAG: protein-S-isoprenylcysteine methyltransferase [Thermoplasmatales archaeon ex4572_165]RLF58052.1 MAG: isoprenylcysteine carboxylmethyltransferase family protein [Thermoplasmata archaeon]